MTAKQQVALFKYLKARFDLITDTCALETMLKDCHDEAEHYQIKETAIRERIVELRIEQKGRSGKGIKIEAGDIS